MVKNGSGLTGLGSIVQTTMMRTLLDNAENLQKPVVAAETWTPCPDITDRMFWNRIVIAWNDAPVSGSEKIVCRMP